MLKHFLQRFFAVAFCAGMAAVPMSGFALSTVSHSPDADAKPHNYRDKNFDYFVSGDPRQSRAKQTQFGLALMGGGGTVDAAFKFIADHAGRGHIVILRAVSDDSFDPDDGDYGEKFLKQWGPVVSAETIVFHHREAANDARVLAALRGADGIFLAGGDQANYIRYWKGTPVQELLNAHVKANRPIGGSSAGLAILGHYSYTAFDGGSMESKVALADPFNSGMTLESDFLHYNFLDDVITDTHFSRRSRLGRLIAFIARLDKDNPAAKIFGIGVDEKTALLIDANGIGQLAPGSAANAWIVTPQKSPTTLVAGQPLSFPDLHLVRLDAKSSIDMKSREVSNAGADVIISIYKGKLAHESIASKMISREVTPPNES